MEHNKGFFRELWDYLKVRKKWWLAPLIILILIMGLLVWFGASSISPFIYALG